MSNNVRSKKIPKISVILIQKYQAESYDLNLLNKTQLI